MQQCKRYALVARRLHMQQCKPTQEGGEVFHNTDGSMVIEITKDPPSVSLALPPVGVQSTAEQLLHTTTLWEWLNTVVLH